MFKNLLKDLTLRVYAVIPEYIESHFRLGDNKQMRVQKLCEYLTDKTSFKFLPNTYKGKNSKGEESVCVLSEHLATAEDVRDIINNFAKDYINEEYFKLDDENKAIRFVFEYEDKPVENKVVKEEAIEYIKRKEGIKDFDIPNIPCVEEYVGEAIEEDFVDPLFVDAPTVRVQVEGIIKYRINVGKDHKVRKGIISRMTPKEISIRESAKLAVLSKQQKELNKLRAEAEKEYANVRDMFEVKLVTLDSELNKLKNEFIRECGLGIAKKFNLFKSYISETSLNYILNDARDVVAGMIKRDTESRNDNSKYGNKVTEGFSGNYFPCIAVCIYNVTGGLYKIDVNISALNNDGNRYVIREEITDNYNATEVVNLIEKRCKQFNKLHSIDIKWFK